MTDERRANVVGLGLIGGSVAIALTQRGWTVSGSDRDAETCQAALDRGLIGAIGVDPEAEVSFVAVPVLAATETALRILEETQGIVTDVGSVKAPICDEITNQRFVGGHPMAGSELDGIDGADPELFNAAIWVLTPDGDADDQVFAALTAIIRSLGSEVVAIDPQRHDDVVAVVSHVPHLTAASLMRLAADRSIRNAALLRLAAGGFRDMTRVASGRPDI